MKKTQLKGVALLLLTALIWGLSFVAQSVGMDSIEGFTFNGIRTLMGAIVLLPFIIIKDKSVKKQLSGAEIQAKRVADKRAVLYGAILGIVFCIGSNFQQFAFNYSGPGKIAFITTLYMFFVPLFGLFMKKKIPMLTWICVFFGFVGLYFLCIDPNNIGTINKGDLYAIICSVLFAVHILLIEKFTAAVDSIKLSCTQFAVSGIISCVLMLIFESPNIAAIRNAAIPLLYSGILSCGLGYTLQIVGQKYTEATVASLLMCMESAFAVLASALILHEVLSGREIVGCAVMFVAIIVSQLAAKLTPKKDI